MRVRLAMQDLVGFHCEDGRLLAALHEALCGDVESCWLLNENCLVVAATAQSKVRAALKRLADRFEVES
ncbi:MAG: hypothetical protein HY303_08150 [Candidatus Wallbacteria bacterium]|nr:hypothetical protein [Candidatus Wallbacteria bacterium]